MTANIDTLIPALKAVLAEDLNLNLIADQIDENVPLLEGGLNLDSIVVVELIGMLESKFNFQFEDSDLRTATFESLRTLAAVMSKRMV